MPKDEKLWIFGSQFGYAFVGNTKYLFEYVAKNKKNIRAVWLSRDKNVLKYLSNSGYEAYLTYSFKGFYYSMKARVVIFSSGVGDINKLIPYDSHTKIIQLWHGFPLKKLTLKEELISSLRKNRMISFVKNIGLRIFPFASEHYDLGIATSDSAREKLSYALKIPLNRVVVTGYPRDDILISKGKPSKIFNNLKRNYDFKYLILYLPTYRGNAHSVSNIFNLLNEKYPFDVDKFDRFLTQFEALFLIRVHPLSRITDQNLIDKINKSQRIKLLLKTPVEESDVYPLLRHTDILVTDYSSVYSDFLLLDRPVIFASFDLENYMRTDKGFYYNYYDVAAGPIAKNWDGVLMYIKEAINQPEKYKEKRERVCKMFNKYKDANSSERVYKAIMDILESSI